MKKKLRVIVMTQNDRFFIPRNIKKASAVCDLVEIVTVNCKSALENRTKDYLTWFGFFQCAKMGVISIARKIGHYADSLTGYRICGGECGVRDAARKLGVSYREISDSNDAEYVNYVKKMQPDLIISYSAPQIIKKELLGVPRYGIINVHGSLLPDYRGTLPSFWYLYNDEKTGGATVHYMSESIDDGLIIRQDKVDISDCRTMFRLMKKTKTLGGELMIKAIEDIAGGTVVTKPNVLSEGRYFSWPTQEQAREFRKRGKALI